MSIRCFTSLSMPGRMMNSTGATGCPTVAETIEELQAWDRAFRTVRVDQLHVTLGFLGDTDEDTVPEISEVVCAVAASQPPFTCRIKGTGVFPGRKRPAVVWAGVEPRDTLQNLAAMLDQQLRPPGFKPERREYTPHLTLARIRGKTPDGFDLWLDAKAETTFGVGRISGIHLVKSELKSDGARYTVLSTAPLAD